MASRVLTAVYWTASIASATASIDESAFSNKGVIERDVAIIGGGASGTYAAVRLREDYNVSIVVVEKEDHLGGHVNTYLDPSSGTEIDYGVLAYLRYGHAADFFARFNIPIKPYASAPQTPVYLSTANASVLPAYTPPSFPDQFAAFQTWLNATAQYEDLVLPGLWNFPPGGSIPADLLSPFGEFARRHGIEATAPLFTAISNVGVGGLEDVLTLYVLFAMGPVVTREFLNSSLFQPDGFSNSELYRRAYGLLADDVLLRSQVRRAKRSDDKGVELVVRRADCPDTLVRAKKLLFTPPPSLARLGPFGVDAYERRVLGTWTKTWSFGAIVQIPGLASNTSYYWYAPAVDATDYLEMRDWPWTMSLVSAAGVPAGEHLFELLFATNYSVSHAEAKATIVREVSKACVNLQQAGGEQLGDCGVDFRAFVDHNSVLWRQSPEQLRDNIVRGIYALQGRKSTWFTGGLWSADYTGNVWAFTESLLPRLIDSLRDA